MPWAVCAVLLQYLRTSDLNLGADRRNAAAFSDPLAALSNGTAEPSQLEPSCPAGCPGHIATLSPAGQSSTCADQCLAAKAEGGGQWSISIAVQQDISAVQFPVAACSVQDMQMFSPTYLRTAHALNSWPCLEPAMNLCLSLLHTGQQQCDMAAQQELLCSAAAGAGMGERPGSSCVQSICSKHSRSGGAACLSCQLKQAAASAAMEQ